MECVEWLENVINQFIGEPRLYWNDYSVEYMIRCEATHYVISASVACLVVYSLIGTTYFQNLLKCHARSTYQFLFWLGVFVSIMVHVCIDAFTKLA